MRHVPVMIGGEPRSVDGSEVLEVRSPATGELVVGVACASEDDVAAAVRSARTAAPMLAAMSPRERAALVSQVADLMEADLERLATDLTVEQGKPISESRGEVAVAVQMWREAAEVVRHQTEEILPSDDPNRVVVVRRRPHGVLAVITPWNFPATIPTEYLCAGLAAGNSIVWKPSEYTSLTAANILECIHRAGFPTGSVNLTPGRGAPTGAALVAHPDVDAVGFTGSPATGDAIARAAGAKPLLLELGGNNATVVMDDVDVSAAASLLAGACYANSGQICSSTERVLVHRSVYEPLAEAMVEQARLLRLGEPLEEDTTIGPLNNEHTAAKVDRHLADATSRGAAVLTGGQREVDRPTTLYYQPTVVTGLSTDMMAFREETFGPVAFLMPFSDADEAVDLVNRHDLGLVAGVLGEDLDRATRVGSQLQAGIVNIGTVATYWQPHTPFGGFSGRSSGVGRLGGRYTVEALTQLQTFTMPRRWLP